jgi:hypothetical protein
VAAGEGVGAAGAAARALSSTDGGTRRRAASPDRTDPADDTIYNTNVIVSKEEKIS